MKFTAAFLVSAAFFAPALSRPLTGAVSRASSRASGIDPSLVPEFGVVAGSDPDGTGNCDGVNGANGKPILIPCSCPPDRDLFIQDLSANVAAGFVVNNTGVSIAFPTDNSTTSQLTRLHAATVTLQNLFGAGVGCPQAATTWGAQAAAIEAAVSSTSAAPASTAVSPPASTVAASPVSTAAASPVSTAASSTNVAVTSAPAASASASSTAGVDPNLVPEFGITAGQNPDGTGNCDGVTGANGQPILIPCSCPPDRDLFIQDLSANVAKGFVVNNTGVAVSFPTDNSTASQLTRLEAATTALQNLFGAGVGCPQAATTWGALAKSIEAAGSSASAPAPTNVAVESAPASSAEASCPAVTNTPSAEPTGAASSSADTSASISSSAAPSASMSSSAAPSTSASVSSNATTPSTTAPSETASSVSASSSLAAPTASASPAPSNSTGVDPNLVPEFGITAGQNPDGTGNCDGVTGANGQPILIPCSCPPDRDLFIQDLSANAAAGFAVNNTGVSVSFPTDNSTASQLTRLEAATVTLQNLFGAGKGCPQAATTWGALAKSIEAGTA